MRSNQKSASMRHLGWFAAIAAAMAIIPLTGTGQTAPTPEAVLTAVKKNLQDSQAQLRKYEWIETTAISLKGEEKSRKQQRVYYGADGKLTKLPIGEPAAAAEAPGGRGGRGSRIKGKIIENKKDEMKDYMEKAAALIHSYVPPSADLVQKAKDAGKMSVLPQPTGRVRAEFKDFIQPSDKLWIEIDPAAGRLGGVNVATYLDKPEDTVTLDVRYGALADGTSFAGQTSFEAKAKNILVVVQNTGHRPMVK
jgi:hypothetical protein